MINNMKNKLKVIVLLSLVLACNSNRAMKSIAKDPLNLTLSHRIKEDGKFKLVHKKVLWNPDSTAVIIIDMWNKHHCVSAEQRVAEMAPFMNKVVQAAREKGVLIIHAPSDCMDFYKDTIQRKRAENAKFKQAAVKFAWNNFNPEYEGPIPGVVAEAGCSCDTPEPCGPDYKAWNCENEALEIAEKDIISDKGQEIYNVLMQEGIENVIIMGVHTNLCILGRPFGIRQMKYLGINTVLCRDLTDSYHRNPGKHFEGLNKIIEHIETYWCPTITSDQLTGLKPFVFMESN